MALLTITRDGRCSSRMDDVKCRSVESEAESRVDRWCW